MADNTVADERYKASATKNPLKDKSKNNNRNLLDVFKYSKTHIAATRFLK